MNRQTLDPVRRMADAEGETKLFSTNEVARLTGASIRQLQWWDEKDILPAMRAGKNQTGIRMYNAEDIRKCRIFLKLRGQPSKLNIPHKALRCRYLLFAMQLGREKRGKQLIAASDDKAEIIKIAAESAHAVTLIEL